MDLAPKSIASDDFNADNFDHRRLAFIRGGQVSVPPADLEAGPMAPP